METALITGGAGFIAHHLIGYLLDNTDWNIISLDRLDYSGNQQRIAEIMEERKDQTDRLKIVWHDLKAPINFFASQELDHPSYIFHLAAGSHVDRSIEYPLEFVMDNVVGTCNLLDFARSIQDNLKMFLYFSTDEVFGPAPEGIHYVEWARYRSGNPYSASKAGAEELCLAYENTYKMPIAITHTMNVMGIRQHPEKFIPMVIRKVLLGEAVTIHANQDKTKAGSRFYINTQDVCDAVKFITENFDSGDKYNIVGERELDNLTLAQMIADIIGKPLVYQMTDFHSERPGHDLRYALDGSKMREMGWSPQKPIDERLREVVQWSLKHPKWIGL